MPPANDGKSRGARGGAGRRGGNGFGARGAGGPMGAFNPQMAPYPGAPLGGPLYAPMGQMLPNPYAGDPSQYGAVGAYGVGNTDAVAAATALGLMNAASGGMHNPMAGGGAGGAQQQTQPHLQRRALSQMQHPPQLAAAARAYLPAGAAGVVGSMDPTAAAFHNPQLAGDGNGRGTRDGVGGSRKLAESRKAKSGGSPADPPDEPDGSSTHPRGPPLRTPSGGGLPRPGTGTSATYARAKHAQLTLKDLAQARDLMIQEIESKGESAQSALKDLVCILKQMGSHAEATATIVRYRAAWPDDDRMQESLDNMLLDLFKHARNLEGQIAVTGQLINYSQKALAEGRTGWMIRTAGCKNTVSVHRRLSTLYRLRGQAQMQSGAWAKAEISLSRALHHERLHVKEEDLSINIDRGACLIATGRLIEAQDLLLHVAATASKVIDAPHKGVGGSSVGTVRRVGLALRALVDVLEKFSGGVRRVARELERTAAVVGGGEQGAGDGDGVVLGQFVNDDEDDAGEDGPINEEKKAEENVEAEAKTEMEAKKSEIEANRATEIEAEIETKTDEGGEEERVSGGSSDGGDENEDRSNVDESTTKKSSSAADRSNRGHHRREGDSLCMEQVLLPAVDHFWRAGPTARMDLLSLKAKQSRRKIELMERAGLSESEADRVAAETVASETGEAAAAAVVTAALEVAATNALGDGDASNRLQDASNDASVNSSDGSRGSPAAQNIVVDAQAPAHPILASAAVAQTSAALASVTAEPNGDGQVGPATTEGAPVDGTREFDKRGSSDNLTPNEQAAAQTSAAVLAAAAGVPNSAAAAAAAAAADPKGIVAAAAAAAADAAVNLGVNLEANPGAMAAMIANAAGDGADSSTITALLRQESDKATGMGAKEAGHHRAPRVSQAQTRAIVAAAHQQQQQQAESLSIQYQQQLVIQQQQIQMQQLALEASQNAAAAQFAQARLAQVSNAQSNAQSNSQIDAHGNMQVSVESLKADQRAEFAAQMLREGAPVSDEGADMLASIQQRQQEALAAAATDNMSMQRRITLAAEQRRALTVLAEKRGSSSSLQAAQSTPESELGLGLGMQIQIAAQEALYDKTVNAIKTSGSGGLINLPDVVTDAMMGDTVSDVVLSSGIDFGDDDELKADVKKTAMSSSSGAPPPASVPASNGSNAAATRSMGKNMTASAKAFVPGDGLASLSNSAEPIAVIESLGPKTSSSGDGDNAITNPVELLF